MNRYQKAILDAINEIYSLGDKEIIETIMAGSINEEEIAENVRELAIDIIRWHMNKAEGG